MQFLFFLSVYDDLKTLNIPFPGLVLLTAFCRRGADKCYNRTLCEEHLNLLLPAKPPFHPRQFATCAVVGNSGDLLKTEFGEEIDSHDAVIRDNEAPVNEVLPDFLIIFVFGVSQRYKLLDFPF